MARSKVFAESSRIAKQKLKVEKKMARTVVYMLGKK
jgi:hypothetical protein